MARGSTSDCQGIKASAREVKIIRFTEEVSMAAFISGVCVASTDNSP